MMNKLFPKLPRDRVGSDMSSLTHVHTISQCIHIDWKNYTGDFNLLRSIVNNFIENIFLERYQDFQYNQYLHSDYKNINGRNHFLKIILTKNIVEKIESKRLFFKFY